MPAISYLRPPTLHELMDLSKSCVDLGRLHLLCDCTLIIKASGLIKRYTDDRPAIPNHHSLLRHITNINKQVAIPPSLISTLDGQLRGTVKRRPGAPIHDEPSTTGDVLAVKGKETTVSNWQLFLSVIPLRNSLSSPGEPHAKGRQGRAENGELTSLKSRYCRFSRGR